MNLPATVEGITPVLKETIDAIDFNHSLEVDAVPVIGWEGYPYIEISGISRPVVQVTESARDEARSRFDGLERAMQRADDKDVRAWLINVGLLCAGKMSREDADAKVRAYMPSLKYPSFCFTDETRNEAARLSNGWFPDYDKLCKYFDDVVQPYLDLKRSLERIVNALEMPPLLEKPKRVTPEQTEEHMKTFREKMGLSPDYKPPKRGMRRLGNVLDSDLSPTQQKQVRDELAEKTRQRIEKEKQQTEPEATDEMENEAT